MQKQHEQGTNFRKRLAKYFESRGCTVIEHPCDLTTTEFSISKTPDLQVSFDYKGETIIVYVEARSQDTGGSLWDKNLGTAVVYAFIGRPIIMVTNGLKNFVKNEQDFLRHVCQIGEIGYFSYPEVVNNFDAFIEEAVRINMIHKNNNKKAITSWKISSKVMESKSP